MLYNDYILFMFTKLILKVKVKIDTFKLLGIENVRTSLISRNDFFILCCTAYSTPVPKLALFMK